YSDVGTTTVARSVLEMESNVGIDVLAVSMLVLLDALGLHDLTLETWAGANRRHVWSVDDASRAETTAEILQVAIPASPAAEPADVVVRWLEDSVAVAAASRSTPRIELTAHLSGDQVHVELSYRELDRDLDVESMTQT